MWSTRELIVAPATRPGFGCRSVVRLSGDGLEPLLRTLFDAGGEGFAGPGGPPRLVTGVLAADGLGREWGGVRVEILHWPGPAGPTGGPLAEVQLPASPPLAAAVVAEACRLGARMARGGEFTLRAFLAGRLDLVQAEAVLAVVDATTPAELSAALDALAGGVGRDLRALRESLLDLAADMEAAIDFADETTPDAVPVADAAARAGIDARMARHVAEIEGIAARLAGRDATAAAGLPRVVLAGPPNVGKSSLFNRLVGRDAALVADEPGTTRDWIVARLDRTAGEPACLIVDVAGVMADAAPIGQGVAAEADARARAEIAGAAVLVACRDACGSGHHASGRDVSGHRWPAGDVPRIDVITRCDIEPPPHVSGPAGTVVHDAARDTPVPDDVGVIRTSSRTGLGVGELRTAILHAVAALPAATTPATARMRAALAAALSAVVAARKAGDEAVAAACIRRAVAVIDDVTGAALDTDLIDRVFARHCIGK